MHPPGYVLWQGRSRIDGRPIVAIATLASRNTKTGPMAQVWILRSHIDPVRAVANDGDRSICGDCPLRGRSGKRRVCYVCVHQAPLAVYRAYRRGAYPKLPDYGIFADRDVRGGAYGDPIAVPAHVWRQTDRQARTLTSYTHGWTDRNNRAYRQWCMASCETTDHAIAAQRLGWRTFRVTWDATTTLADNEIVCPASRGNLTCSQCGRCNGRTSPRAKNIVIAVHGGPARISQFSGE